MPVGSSIVTLRPCGSSEKQAQQAQAVMIPHQTKPPKHQLHHVLLTTVDKFSGVPSLYGLSTLSSSCVGCTAVLGLLKVLQQGRTHDCFAKYGNAQSCLS